MHISRASKRNKNFHTPKTSGDFESPNVSISNQNVPSIHSQIIPLSKSILMNSQKPVSIPQEQIASEEERDCYFTSLQSHGYLDITDTHTYSISKYETNTRKLPFSLHKTSQLSQYIIINSNKTLENKRRQSRSLNDKTQALTTISSGSDRLRSTSDNRKKHQRNISLIMKMVKQKSIQENVKITRARRTDKGGVVDLALPDIDREHSPIQYFSQKLASSPKKRELAAIVIQRWWKKIMILFRGVSGKLRLIQAVFRGYLIRKWFVRELRLERERRRKLQQQSGIFLLFLIKTVQLKIESYKHNLLHLLAQNAYAQRHRERNYNEGMKKLTCYCQKMRYVDVLYIFKLKQFGEIIIRLVALKRKDFWKRFRTHEIQPESLKTQKLKQVVTQRKILNEKEALLILFKSFRKLKHKGKHLLSNNVIANLIVKEHLQLSQRKSQSKTTKKKILFKSLSLLDFKNTLLMRSSFFRWRRKAQTNPKRQIVKGKKKLLHCLLRNICMRIIDNIRKESNRRKLIRMLLHITNVQRPSLWKAMEKISIYSEMRYDVLNAYASFIQSYYRKKKERRGILIEIRTKQTSQIESEDQIESDRLPVQRKSSLDGRYFGTIRKTGLDPRQTFGYLTRRIFIKAIVYTLMVAI